MSAVERRVTPVPVQLRDGAAGKRVGGYAAVFGVLSRNLGGFTEEIAPDAFTRSQTAGWPDVVARFNHRDDMLLGTTKAGTLSLAVDGVGLGYEVLLPESRGDVLELIQRGDVGNSSFAFRAVADDWSKTEQGMLKRLLNDVELVDVAPVVNPAYTDTSVGLRAFESLQRRFNVGEEELLDLIANGELDKLFARSASPMPPAGRVKWAELAAQLIARRYDPWDRPSSGLTGKQAQLELLAKKDPSRTPEDTARDAAIRAKQARDQELREARAQASFQRAAERVAWARSRDAARRVKPSSQ